MNILVVDESEKVRGLYTARLSKKGHEVTAISDWRDTITAYKRNKQVGRTFDMAIIQDQPDQTSDFSNGKYIPCDFDDMIDKLGIQYGTSVYLSKPQEDLRVKAARGGSGLMRAIEQTERSKTRRLRRICAEQLADQNIDERVEMKKPVFAESQKQYE